MSELDLSKSKIGYYYKGSEENKWPADGTAQEPKDRLELLEQMTARTLWISLKTGYAMPQVALLFEQVSNILHTLQDAVSESGLAQEQMESVKHQLDELVEMMQNTEPQFHVENNTGNITFISQSQNIGSADQKVLQPASEQKSWWLKLIKEQIIPAILQYGIPALLGYIGGLSSIMLQ